VRDWLVKRFPRRLLERGTTTIEFALVFPALAAILFGLIDAGRFIATRTMLAQAAAAGARASCLSTASTSTVDSAVRAAAPGLSTISVDWSNSPCVGTCTWPREPGDLVTLRVQYSFVPGMFTGFRKIMANDARMTCNNP
jgi:Flp pilus assembly protein TadG